MSTDPTMAARNTSWNKPNRKAGLCPFAATCAMGVILLGFMAVPRAQGQTFSVLYTFTNPADGYSPGSLTVDAAGNLYGRLASRNHERGKRPVAGCDLGSPKGFWPERRRPKWGRTRPRSRFLPRAVLLVKGCKWLVHKCVSGRNFVGVLELSTELWLRRTVL